VRILGVDLARQGRRPGEAERVLVSLGAEGRLDAIQRVPTLPGIAAAVAKIVADEPFVLGVNTPVVVPSKLVRTRPVENLVRRRFRYRLPPGGRATLQSEPTGVVGDALITALGAAGLPCLPYPDRDGRRSGLAETYPGLALKALLWDTSPLALAAGGVSSAREELFRAMAPQPYRAAEMPARSGWADQAVALELVLRSIEQARGFDVESVQDQLARAQSAADVEHAASVFDALLIAGTVRRYLDSPEHSVFVGDLEGGYVILPADGLIRRLALGEPRPTHGKLFPQGSLAQRLGRHARLHSPDLLDVPGRPRRVEAVFGDESPRYEFDNVDEMLWWKHCRHVKGPRLPTEGLREILVTLDGEARDGDEPTSLRLVRSRHRTLSFRFDPPGLWRRRVPTRDGKTYPFRVLRAVYDTASAQD